MLRFRLMRSLQKFVAIHSSVHNHFNQERHLYSWINCKLNRTAALAKALQKGGVHIRPHMTAPRKVMKISAAGNEAASVFCCLIAATRKGRGRASEAELRKET